MRAWHSDALEKTIFPQFETDSRVAWCVCNQGRRETASSAQKNEPRQRAELPKGKSLMRRGVPQQAMGERKPSPTSPSASAATAAVSLGHLQRTHLSESLWVAFLVEPATSRVIEALAKFTAVAVEIAKLCVSHVGRMRLYTNGIGGGEGACRRSWRPCELLPEIICATLWEGSGMAARSLPEKGVIISVLTFPPSPIHQS